jgi:hypothetical protein
MSVMNVIREIAEFRSALSSGTLKPLDGWELAHSITETGVEYYSSQPIMLDAAGLNAEVTLNSELTGLIEDLGGAAPVLARSEDDIEPGFGGGGALIKILLPIAMKLLLEWLNRQNQN